MIATFAKFLAGLTAIGFILAMAWGWIMNIVTLIQGGYEATSTVILGFIGIFVAFVGPIVYYVAG